MEVEAADGIDFDIEEFDADWVWVLPSKEVNDAATLGKLATVVDLADFFEAEFGELGKEGTSV
jgi:hypothetical protein